MSQIDVYNVIAKLKAYQPDKVKVRMQSLRVKMAVSRSDWRLLSEVTP